MKVLSLFASSFLLSTCLYAYEDTLQIDTSEGYPYKNLIHKADKVSIKYVESKKRIECKVIILTNNQIFEGENHKVSQKQFKKAPMAACMDRAFAKRLIEQL